MTFHLNRKVVKMGKAVFISALVLCFPALSGQPYLEASELTVTDYKVAQHVKWDGNDAFPVVRGPGLPVPLQMPDGVVIDSGYYDYQENGSMPKKIIFTSTGAAHAVWFSSPDDTGGFPNRNCWYYYATAGGLFSYQGVVSTTRSGFPEIDIMASSLGLGDAAIISCHSADQPSAVNTSTLFTDAFEGLGAFTPHFDNLQDNTGEDNLIIWPKIAVSQVTTGVTVAANVFASGVPDYQWVTYLDPDSVLAGNMDPWYNLTPDLSGFNGAAVEWPTVAAYEDGTVGIIVNDIAGDMRFWESPTGDFSLEDWTLTNITEFDNSELDTIDGGEIDTTKIGFRPWHTSDFIYDTNGTPHIVWAEGRSLVDGTTGEAVILASLEVGGEPWSLNYRIKHWDPVTGSSIVYTSTRGTQDSLINTVNTLPTSYPTVGVSDGNQEVYVVFNEFRDEWRDDDLADFGFGELFCVAATNGDTNWTENENVLNVSNAPMMDDRFPSIARLNPDGLVHLLYVTDPEGGNFAFNGGGALAPVTLVHLMYNAFEPPEPAPPVTEPEVSIECSPDSAVVQAGDVLPLSLTIANDSDSLWTPSLQVSIIAELNNGSEHQVIRPVPSHGFMLPIGGSIIATFGVSVPPGIPVDFSCMLRTPLILYETGATIDEDTCFVLVGEDGFVVLNGDEMSLEDWRTYQRWSEQMRGEDVFLLELEEAVIELPFDDRAFYFDAP